MLLIAQYTYYNSLNIIREIQELYSGTLPGVRVQTECRCQASHPRIKPQLEHYCIANGVDDADNDAVLRLNSEAHNLEFVNDGDSNTYWISQFQNNIELTIDLQDDFQVILKWGPPGHIYRYWWS